MSVLNSINFMFILVPIFVLGIFTFIVCTIFANGVKSSKDKRKIESPEKELKEKFK